MSHNDLVAAFWRPLKERVDRSGVGLKSLGRAVGLSPPALSETLNGRRAKAPDLDLVLAIARACDEDRVDFWRHRLDELVSELERAGPAPGAVARRERGGTTEAEARPGCPGCQDAYEGDRFAEYDWAVEDEWEPSHFLGAARVLAGEHADLRHEAQALVEGVLGVPAHVTAFRDQFTDLTDRLLAGLGRRVRRSCHGHRVRLLHAAHTVVVIEGGVGGPIIDLSHDMPGTSRREVEVARLLRDSFGDGTFASAPLPVAGTHYADHRTRVQQHYAEAALETRGEALPAAAVEECAARYEGRLLDLAAECPELFVWASLQDGPTAAKALRARPAGPGRARLEALYRQLHDQKTGLDGLESLLCALARDITPGIWPARLSAVYRRELSRPISPVGEAGDNLPGPTIPRLARGYVNPAFRTAVHTHDSRPHSDAWWNTRPLRQEIQGFLAGHLSAFPVVGRPLVVLGDPGSGKSLLTRLLAARLPPTDYLPIRIELRNVIADSEIDEQIAYALHQATQKTLTWETVTGTNDRVLPVLIFDGFDELLQAGGTGHWGYLEEIAEFQRTSADNGCPVAAIVTSRTVVADQTHFPDGTVIIRLEPFDAPRVARWTGAWNTTNRRLGRPLRGDLARLHPELAPQPLLLLMLALYHSVDPGPGDDAVPMSRVSLYERLLGLFVRRQIRKLEPRLPPEALEEKVEDELDLLSVIACAMFNRGRQGVSAEEADHDLRYLRAPDRGTDHSEARLLFGRFF
ncbi:NACHT N-terminal helical domain 7-containing protein, partial [Streptomyces sp. NPDC002740]